MKIETFEQACQQLDLDPVKSLPDVSMCPKKHAQATVAFFKLFIIAEATNQGWKPDWNNSSEYKWYPWFDLEKDEDANPSGFRFGGSYCGDTGTGTPGGSRLCFKSRADAEHVGKNFIDLYREIMILQ